MPSQAVLDFVNRANMALPPAPQAAQIVEPNKPEGLADNFSAGISSGVDNTQGMFYGLGAMAGDAFGLDGLKQWGVEGYKRNEEEAQLNGQRVGSIGDIKSANDFFDWAAGSLGQVAPSLFVTAATGGAGAVAGGSTAMRGVLEGVGKKLVAKRLRDEVESGATAKIVEGMVAKGVAKDVAEKAARDAVVKHMGQEWGAVMGAYTGSTMMNTGDLYNQLRERGVQDAPGYALAGGSIMGLMDIIPEVAAFKDIAGKAVEKEVFKSIKDGLKKSGTTIGKYSALEGLTEGTQEGIAVGTTALADPTFDPTSHESIMRIADNFAAGAIVGAIGGGGVSAIKAVKSARFKPEVQQEQTPPPPPPGGQQQDQQQTPPPPPPGGQQGADFTVDPNGTATATDTRQAPPQAPPPGGQTAPQTGQQNQQVDELPLTDDEIGGIHPDQLSEYEAMLAGNGGIVQRNWTPTREQPDEPRAPTAEDQALAAQDATSEVGTETQFDQTAEQFSPKLTRVIGSNDTEFASLDAASLNGWARSAASPHEDGVSDSVMNRLNELKESNPDMDYQIHKVVDPHSHAETHVIGEYQKAGMKADMVFNPETRTSTPMTQALAATVNNARRAAHFMLGLGEDQYKRVKELGVKEKNGTLTEAESAELADERRKRAEAVSMNETFVALDPQTGKVVGRPFKLNLHRLTVFGMKLDQDKSGSMEERAHRGLQAAVTELYSTPMRLNTNDGKRNSKSSVVVVPWNVKKLSYGQGKSTRAMSLSDLLNHFADHDSGVDTLAYDAKQVLGRDEDIHRKVGKVIYDANERKGKTAQRITTRTSLVKENGKWSIAPRQPEKKSVLYDHWIQSLTATPVENGEPKTVQVVPTRREINDKSRRKIGSEGLINANIIADIKDADGQVVGYIRDSSVRSGGEIDTSLESMNDLHEAEVYLVDRKSKLVEPHPEFYIDKFGKLQRVELSNAGRLGSVVSDKGVIRRVLQEGGRLPYSKVDTGEVVPTSAWDMKATDASRFGSTSPNQRQLESRDVWESMAGKPESAPDVEDHGIDTSALESTAQQEDRIDRMRLNPATLPGSSTGGYTPAETHQVPVENMVIEGSQVSGRASKMTMILNDLMKHLGIHIPTIVFSVEQSLFGATNSDGTSLVRKKLVQRYGNYYGGKVHEALLKAADAAPGAEGSSFSLNIPGHGWFIYLDPRVKGVQSIEHMFHEAGHVFVETLYDNAPESMKAELRDMFNKERTGVDFHEWMAHKFTQWAGQSHVAKSAVEKWLSAAADVMKKIFTYLTRKYAKIGSGPAGSMEYVEYDRTFEHWMTEAAKVGRVNQYYSMRAAPFRSLGTAAATMSEPLPPVEMKPEWRAPASTVNADPQYDERNVGERKQIIQRNWTPPRDVSMNAWNRVRAYLQKFDRVYQTGQGFKKLAMKVHDTIFASMDGRLKRMRTATGGDVKGMDYFRSLWSYIPGVAQRMPWPDIVEGRYKHWRGRFADVGKSIRAKYSDPVEAKRIEAKVVEEMIKHDLGRDQFESYVDANGRRQTRVKIPAYDPEVAEYCLQLRQRFEEAHSYLKSAGLPIREAANYFPRVYDKVKLDAERDAAIELLVKNAGQTPEQAANILDSILQDNTLVELTESEQQLGATAFAAIKHRKLSDKIVKALSDGGYLETDLGAVLNSYSFQMTRRAEFNRVFGQNINDHKHAWTEWIKKAEGQLGLWKAGNDARGALRGSLNSQFTYDQSEANEATIQLKERIAALTEMSRMTNDPQVFRELMALEDALYRSGQHHNQFSPELQSALEASVGPMPRYNPAKGINEMLAGLREQLSRPQQEELNSMVNTLFGQVGQMDPALKRSMAQVMVYQNMRLLAFTVFSSFPDLVTPMIRGNGVAPTLRSYIRQLTDSGRKDDVQRLMRAYGFAVESLEDHMLSNAAGGDPATMRAHEMTEKFFKYTGVRWWENFTRSLTMSTAIDYIIDAAEQGDTAKLSELGLDAYAVRQWNEGGRRVGNSAIDQALARFVREGKVMHVATAQKTQWGADPRFMLVWHLNGYMYEFQHKIMGRIWHKLNNTSNTADQLSWVAPALLGLALAGFGLELRELIQYSLWGKGEEDRTDKMGGAEYLYTLVQRAGFFGLGQKLTDMIDAGVNGRSPFVSLLGPTGSQVNDAIQRPLANTVASAIPGVNNVTGLKEEVKDFLNGK